jgi:hypothetical protein
VDESGIDEELHVMRDRRLALANGLDEVADADLAIGRCAEEIEEAEPHRVSKGGETLGQLVGVVLVEGRCEDRRTTVVGREFE